ncbi:MAG TPA: DHH family phosphoesterase, partial [Longimicrobiaceae bacterium]|nr:DHH family phosphoesterase [Longimicrobiaceae bacterium]
MTDPLAVPRARADGLTPLIERLRSAGRVVLTTHVNADGDGIGSQVAVAAWLNSIGVGATIVNPTPFPANLGFLVTRPGLVADLGTAAAARALREADLFLVLDTSEPNRVAPLLDHLDPERTLVVDHHPAGPTVVGTHGVQDPTAAAAGELAFDLLRLADAPPLPAADLGIYVAIVSDTGSFRFSNTSPRAHRIAATLLEHGVDPEAVFQRLFATAPLRRLELLRAALGTLESDPRIGL